MMQCFYLHGFFGDDSRSRTQATARVEILIRTTSLQHILALRSVPPSFVRAVSFCHLPIGATAQNTINLENHMRSH